MLGGFYLANIEEKVEELLQNKIEELGYELYDVEYAKEGKNYFLRIFIDNEKGIDLNDCEKVNDGIMDLLDEADYIKEQYFLEVSSPGIERILRKEKHLDGAIGEEIEVNLFKPIEKQKSLDGILTGYDEKYITVKCENEEISIERKNISLMKTKYNW
jgi:ribosome maturation factor RimP